MVKQKTISIIIPAYNEQENIAELTRQLHNEFKKLPRYKFEVIVVENASEDMTYSTLVDRRKEFPWLKILQLAKNVGCDGAIVAGLSYAQGDAAIVIMADLQENPKLMPSFIKKWEDGNDVVY